VLRDPAKGAGAEMRYAALLALGSVRCWVTVVAASVGLPTVLAISGERQVEVEFGLVPVLQ